MTRLPHDPEAEVSFLATCCAPGGSEAFDTEIKRLTPEHFVVPRNRAVFEALHALTVAGEEVNAISLKAQLEAAKALGTAGGFSGITDVLSAPEVGRPFRIVEILTDLLKRRRLLKLASAIARTAQEDGEDLAALCTGTMTELGMIARDGQKEVIGSWAEILEIMDRDEPFRDGTGERAGWWGIPELDEVAPIPAGQVTFIAARPGVGKTALMTQVAVESAMQGRKPLIVSIELPRKTVLARVASYITGISTRRLKEAAYSRFDFEKARDHVGTLLQGSVISPSAGTSWDKLEATVLESIEKFGTDLVLIDYFSLIGRQVAKGSSEAYAFAKVSERITAFAKDHQNVGVVLLGQLKADEANKEPKDGGAADSDRPARDAAVSLFLWRDGSGQVWSVLTKNRDGALSWKKPLEFDGVSQHFTLKRQEAFQPQGRLAWRGGL